MQQAEDLRPRIESLGIDRVYSSTSQRTRQTAAILTRNLDAPTTYIETLREIHLGPWETHLWGDIERTESEQAELFQTQPHKFSLQGAETFLELQRRGVAAIESIIAQENVDNVLVVSHGALLKAILVHFADIALSELWREPHLHNCSHSILQTGADGHRQLASVAGMDLAAIGWR